jgi:hypothetical protein
VRTVSTWTQGNGGCFFAELHQQPGRLQHRGTIFRNGVPCVVGPWGGNPTTNWIVEHWTYENYSLRCGGGTISHDTYHQVYLYNLGRMTGSRPGSPFPTTFHHY